jgi:hypothetical protein
MNLSKVSSIMIDSPDPNAGVVQGAISAGRDRRSGEGRDTLSSRLISKLTHTIQLVPN